MNQRHYLEALGITLWRLRDQPPSSPAAPPQRSAPPRPAVVTDPPPVEPVAAPPVTTSPSAEDSPCPVPVQAETARAQPSPPPEEPERPELPAEYAQWASLAAEEDRDGDLDLDLEPPLSPEQQRVARIATLDWDDLWAEVDNCTACPLHQSRTRPVFGVGNRQASWMIIGEAPGAEEDRRGEPFVGKAGQLLDAMLRAVNLDRQQVFIANVLKSRPPNNRDPLPEEAAACWPFLTRQIELVRPDIVLAVGRIAAHLLLDTDTPVGRLRGRVHRLQPGGIPMIVTYHPAYLLRSPREKRKAWDDLQLARRTVKEEGKRP